MFLYILVAIAISDPINSHATQNLGYYANVSDCEKDKQKIEPSINKSFTKLSCVQIKVNNDE